MKLAKITLANNESSYKCSSGTVYNVLFWMFFIINVGGIGAFFIRFHWYLRMLLVKQQCTKDINGKSQTN